MSTHSNSSSDVLYSSSSSDDGIISEYIWEYINDPVEEQIESQIRDEFKAQLVGTSSQHRGKSRRHIQRDREAGHDRLFADYFSDNPVYTDYQFRRRYRMRRHVFLQIVQTLSERSSYFCQRSDAFSKVGFSPLQKCTTSIRMLGYGTSADQLDETFRIGGTTVHECLKLFCKGVIENFGEKYLRKPTNEDTQRLLQIGQDRGFPGMLGSIDCMHWEWKNCPVAWKGQFTRGDYGVPTIMLEAVASQDLWIWHAFFGVAGSNNDINVLNQSTLFTESLQGRAPEVEFMVNGNEYKMGYYLADGIYPEWATFVKTIPLPQNDKARLFAQKQEGARKDVERAFGVLQARWAILRGPARAWHRRTLGEIMYACIILHNMIVEDERDTYEHRYDFNYDEGPSPTPLSGFAVGPIHEFSRVLEKSSAIRDRPTHRRLKDDLVEHIWQRFGGNQA